MPYIPQEKRENLVLPPLPYMDAGDLNYVITKLVLKWTEYAPCYAIFNAAIGVLECAKQELYRRMVAPYEDQKCAENGDVYRDGGGI